MDQKVFANRVLNLKKIKYIGLDMDHTLIRYNIKNFESLVYQMVIQKLVTDKHYPKEILKFEFKFSDAIRGLIIDSKNGNILKLSRYSAIKRSYHGTQEISFEEQKKFYRSIYVDLKDENYIAIDTSFSIAFCVLYSQLVDIKDKKPHELPSYAIIAKDVMNTVDNIHEDGSLKGYITQHIEDFVLRDPKVVEGIKQYLRFGKKFFLLTNSQYSYADLLLKYAINPFLDKNESWHDLFEYVITLANKPRFFYDADNVRFLSVNPENATMSNTFGSVHPGVYQGGNARKFTEDLGIIGEEILYIGDHIYDDILRLKKDCNWRTALVVEELNDEITSQKKASSVDHQIKELMLVKISLEHEYIKFCTQKIDEKTHAHNQQIATIQNKITEVDHQITKHLHEEKNFYNPRWGRIFRAGAEESYFAYQVEQYACIYMEKLSNLLEQSPLTYFRANQRPLAHDL